MELREFKAKIREGTGVNLDIIESVTSGSISPGDRTGYNESCLDGYEIEHIIQNVDNDAIFRKTISVTRHGSVNTPSYWREQVVDQFIKEINNSK